MNTLLLLAITLAFGSSYLAIPQIIKVALKKNLVDTPGGRKQHKAPTPSLGGIAIFGSFWIATGIISFITNTNFELLPLMVASVILFILGLKDDLTEVRALYKLAIQLGVASLLYFTGLCHFDNLYGLLGFYEIHPIAGFIISILTTTLIINAYNLIDGINGLTGSITVLSSLIFGAFFLQNGLFIWAIIAFTLAASTLGFLKYNFGKASIFMGDNGSTFIGLVFSVLFFQMLHADYPATNMFPVALSLISIPVFDLIRVFLFRISQKRGPFSPDRSHIHHIMLNTLGSAETVVYYILGFNILIIASMAILGSNMSLFTSGIILATCVWSFPILVKRVESSTTNLA